MTSSGVLGEDVLLQADAVPGLPADIVAWTTTKAMGSFGLGSTEAVSDVMARWDLLQSALAQRGVQRLATAHQVHGADVVIHRDGWRGWLRERGVDGHVTAVAGTALAITIADCTPVFVAHPAGVIAALHAGWRGTAAGILSAGLEAMTALGCPPNECVVHLGPSICGSCYEVGPEVLSAITGRPASGKGYLDVRAVLAEQAKRSGVDQVTVSAACTRCDNTAFFSHRGGDAGRQLGVIAVMRTGQPV